MSLNNGAVPKMTDDHRHEYDPWTISLPSNGQEPKAIIVMVGWWGSLPRHLEKYSSTIYTQWNCATLSGTAQSRDIMFKKDDALHAFAHQGLMKLSEFLQSHNNPRLPVFFHLFSNGGGFVWEHMESLLESTNDRLFSSISSIDTEDTPLHCNTNFYIIRRNLCGLIYDSCPAYPTWRSGKAALEGSMGAAAPCCLKYFLTCLLYIGYLLEQAYNFLRGAKHHRLVDWWNLLLKSDLCDQEAFVYSTADTVTESSYLQDFIAERKARRAAFVSVLELEDSEHVQHFRMHPERYTEFTREFVTDCLRIHKET